MAKMKQKVSTNEVVLARIEKEKQDTRLQFLFHVSRLAISLIRKTVIVAGWCFAAWMVQGVFLGLAGKETVADIAIRLVGKISAPEWLAYAFGVGGVGVGYYERRLRKKTIAEQTRHTEVVEKKVDPNRRSSMLSRDGGNKKEHML